MLKIVVAKDVAYQKQLGHPDKNSYTDTQSQQILKRLMAALISKGIFKEINFALGKGGLCTCLYYFSVCIRQQTQRQNK